MLYSKGRNFVNTPEPPKASNPGLSQERCLQTPPRALRWASTPTGELFASPRRLQRRSILHFCVPLRRNVVPPPPQKPGNEAAWREILSALQTLQQYSIHNTKISYLRDCLLLSRNNSTHGASPGHILNGGMCYVLPSRGKKMPTEKM